MSFVDSIKSFFANYVGFAGRARRSEYWFTVLFLFIVNAIISIIFCKNPDTIKIVSSIWSLVILLPSIALCIRRMHDINKNGWWILIPLIPVIGWIWWIILCCQDSQPGSNQWGPNPKGDAPVEFKKPEE